MIKVTDLARELHCSATAVLNVLSELGIAGTNSHTSTSLLSAGDAGRVREYWDSKSNLIGLAKSVAARFGEEI